MSKLHDLDYVGDPTRNDIQPEVGSTIEPFFDWSLFSIVNETLQRNFESEFQGVPVAFVTDKSFKAFSFFHVPIINGGCDSVAYLRRTGFDMFDDVVDHSYDTVPDENKRLLAVVNEVRRLNRMSLQECQDLKQQLKPRLQANREILHSRRTKFGTILMHDLNKAMMRLRFDPIVIREYLG